MNSLFVSLFYVTAYRFGTHVSKKLKTCCDFLQIPHLGQDWSPSHMRLSRGTLATWLTPLRRDGGILWLCTRIEFLKQWLLLRSSTPSRTAMQGWQRWTLTTLLFVFVSYLYLCQELSELLKILSYVAFMGIIERGWSLSTSYILCFFNSCLWFFCSLWKLSHDRLPRFSHWIER